MSAFSGIIIRLPENFHIDFSNLKPAQVSQPAPTPAGKSKRVVYGGYYVNTRSKKFLEEKLKEFLKWKVEFFRELKNAKKADLPKLPDKSVLENDDPSFHNRLLAYKAGLVYAPGSIIDESI